MSEPLSAARQLAVYRGRIEAFDAVLAYLRQINGNGYDEPSDPALDAVIDKVMDLRSRATAALAVDRERSSILSPVTPIPGLNVKSANDLLSPEAKVALDANLRDMAGTRRAGNAAAATMTLGGVARADERDEQDVGDITDSDGRLLPRGLR